MKKSISFVLFFCLMFSWGTSSSYASSHDSKMLEQKKALEESVKSNTDEYIIKFKSGISNETRKNKLSGFASKEIGSDKLGIYKVSGKNVLYKTIKESLSKDDSSIEYIVPNFKRKQSLVPNDPYYTQQNYLSAINASTAWDVTTGSQYITVAVLDSGIDLSHPDLQGKIVDGHNFLAPGTIDINDIYDLNGHGTFVSGIIGAATNNSTGIAALGWNTKIMPLQVLWSDGSGDDATIISAITYAVDNGARVINMSLGGPDYSQALQNAIDYATSHNVVVVAAAGNDSNSSLEYPAACNGVIGVGSVNGSNSKSSFSNYNSSVDVVAPGENIFSTFSEDSLYYPNTTYMTGNGTSFSTPQVSALAALMLSANPNLTYSQVTNIIEGTSTDLGQSGRDDSYGYGLINAAAAVNQCVIPVSDPGKDRITYKSFNVTLNGTNSKGHNRTYNWRFVNKPSTSTAILQNSISATPNFTADVTGDFIIGLTVSDGTATSSEKTVKVKVKNIGSTTDDIDMTSIGSGVKLVSGYDFSSTIPLTDGWVITKGSGDNTVLFLNALSGDRGKVFTLSGVPGKLVYDVDANTILAGMTNKIAKINVDTGNISYINLDVNDVIGDIVLGNNGILFVKVNNNYSGYYRIINFVNNTIVGNKNCGCYDRYMIYDKVRNNLIAAGAGIYKYSFDPNTYTLTQTQYAFITGNDLDFVISHDNNHIALSSGGGNGSGYTIFDIDSSDITKKFGEWNTGAYPTSADFSLDNNYIVTYNGSHIVIFDVNSHAVVKNVCSVDDSYNKVRFSKGEKLIFYIGSSELACYQGIVQPVAINSLDVDKVSPQIAGNTITITVSASGGNTRLYQFWMRKSTDAWQVVRDYGTSNVYTWTPTDAGDYYIEVHVKDSASTNNFDAFADLGYKITSVVPAKIAGVTFDKSSPQTVNTAINITTSATSGSQTLYQFWIMKSTGSWQIVQDYGTSNIYTWTPTDAGDYYIEVHVKDAASSSAFDDFKDLSYKISSVTVTPASLSGVTFDKASPQPANTVIKITASATSGSQTLYQFWIRKSTGSWQIVQDYGTSNIYTWTPTDTGDYYIEVHVKDAASSNGFDDFKDLSYKISSVTVTSASLSGVTFDKASPQPANTVIKITASATSGSQTLYQFWIRKSTGSWQIVQDYGTSNIYTWTPADTGDYYIEVHVKDAASLNGFDDFKDLSYKISSVTVIPASLSGVTFDKASPQTANTAIKITANATSGSQTLYQFWIRKSTGSWQIAQDYGTSNIYTWTPVDTGDYYIEVHVKDAASSNGFDDFKDLSYKISSVTVIPASLSGVTFDKTSPQPANTAMKITANATSGSQTLYQFWIRKSTGSWQIVQDYGTSNIYTWTPVDMGDYFIEVHVKDAASSNGFDDFKDLSYKISSVTVTPASLSGVTFDKASPQPANTVIKITASATSGSQTLYQFWIRKSTGSWQIVQDYGTSNIYTWTPADTGDYYIEVHVKDAASSNGFDDFKDLSYKISSVTVTPASLSGVTFDNASPQHTNTTIKITASATSGSQALYQFWIRKTTGSWQMVQDYSSSNVYTWTPTDAGDYYIEVHAKDASSANSFDDFKDLSYSITT